MKQAPPLSARVQGFASGAASVQSYVQELLARTREREAQIHAWAALDEARALALAEECDRSAVDEKRPLRGVPFGVKDIIATADLPTQMGSAAFAGHRPGRDAAIVERLRQAGAFVMGKTHTTEFAFMHPAPTRNPWNVSHSPGGSSAGSAAAVAAGFVPAALGTQTNGSVIRPAAYCGIVGFKPTLGVLPYGGALQFAPTFDQMGTFAASVADAAFITAPLAEGEALSAAVQSLPRAPRLGMLPNFPWNSAEPETLEQLEVAANRLRSAGAVLDPVSLPLEVVGANVAHRRIMLYEAARELGAIQKKNRAILTPEINAGLDEGARIPASDYRAALAERASVIERMSDVFEGFDAVASPPAPGAAPRRLDITGDPSFCTLWTMVGFPAITLPSGSSRAGLPFGFQLAALPGDDNRLIAVAAWCESQFKFSALA